MINVKSKFNEEQQLTLADIGITLDDNKDYSVEELMAIHDKVTDHYMSHGFDKDDNPTEVGLVCESIIDLFYDEFDI